MARKRDGRPAGATRTPSPDDSRSWASTPAVRARMQRQRTRDTAPELAIRRLLHAAGLRYRVDVAPLPGMRRRADIVFGVARVAIFVDGCFWHGCPQHGSRTTHSNSRYWAEKIERNRSRDVDTDQRLTEVGWLPLRVWEHEDPRTVADMVIEIIRSRT
jgi:DNA mismatch endonuclease (patch repair protein)